MKIALVRSSCPLCLAMEMIQLSLASDHFHSSGAIPLTCLKRRIMPFCGERQSKLIAKPAQIGP
jgi:hypothetical protein